MREGAGGDDQDGRPACVEEIMLSQKGEAKKI